MDSALPQLSHGAPQFGKSLESDLVKDFVKDALKRLRQVASASRMAFGAYCGACLTALREDLGAT